MPAAPVGRTCQLRPAARDQRIPSVVYLLPPDARGPPHQSLWRRPSKTFCVYEATDEELIMEHARMTGFPCNSVLLVSRMIDPETEKA